MYLAPLPIIGTASGVATIGIVAGATNHGIGGLALTGLDVLLLGVLAAVLAVTGLCLVRLSMRPGSPAPDGQEE
jgi:hypothetical protein